MFQKRKFFSWKRKKPKMKNGVFGVFDNIVVYGSNILFIRFFLLTQRIKDLNNAYILHFFFHALNKINFLAWKISSTSFIFSGFHYFLVKIFH